MTKLLVIMMMLVSVGLAYPMSIDSSFRNVAVQMIPAEGVISSEFGYRHYPFRKCHRRCRVEFHSGIDIANGKATPVLATGSGVVVKVKRERGYGLNVEIDHGQGWNTMYGHLSAAKVGVGMVVTPGLPIGAMGSSGRSTGTHLHYELRHGDTPVDPTSFLQHCCHGKLGKVLVAER